MADRLPSAAPSRPRRQPAPATDQTPSARLISSRLHDLPQPGRHTTMPRRVALHPLPHRSPVLRLPASTRPGLRPLSEQLLSSRCRTRKHPRCHPIRTVLSVNTQQPTHHRMRGISHRNAHLVRAAIRHTQLLRDLRKRRQVHRLRIHCRPRRPPLHLSHLHRDRLIRPPRHRRNPATHRPHQRRQIRRPGARASLDIRNEALQHLRYLLRLHHRPVRCRRHPRHSPTITSGSDNRLDSPESIRPLRGRSLRRPGRCPEPRHHFGEQGKDHQAGCLLTARTSPARRRATPRKGKPALALRTHRPPAPQGRREETTSHTTAVGHNPRPHALARHPLPDWK
jgi:hypothetical protein